MSEVRKLDPLGLCHGIRMNDPPGPEWVVHKYETARVSKMMLMLRCAEKDTQFIIPLLDYILSRKSNFSFNVILVVPSCHLKLLATNDHGYVDYWVNTFMVPYSKFVTQVCVGYLSELTPDPDNSLKPTIHDFERAFENVNHTTMKLNCPTKVSTMVDVSMLVNYQDNLPYNANTPPSNFKFDDRYEGAMRMVIKHLKGNSIAPPVPLFAKIFPYFQVNPDFENIILSNYLINDGANIYMHDQGYSYKYVYDAMLDSINNALEILGSNGEVPVHVVTGWPTEGACKLYANTRYQEQYINNLRRHANSGTPRKPGQFIPNYVYCLVDQNQDPQPEIEWKHFGIVPYPDPQA